MFRSRCIINLLLCEHLAGSLEWCIQEVTYPFLLCRTSNPVCCMSIPLFECLLKLCTEKSKFLNTHNWASQAVERKVYMLRLCHPPGVQVHPALFLRRIRRRVCRWVFSRNCECCVKWNVGPPYVISLRVDGTWACPTLYSSLFYSV